MYFRKISFLILVSFLFSVCVYGAVKGADAEKESNVSLIIEMIKENDSEEPVFQAYDLLGDAEKLLLIKKGIEESVCTPLFIKIIEKTNISPNSLSLFDIHLRWGVPIVRVLIEKGWDINTPHSLTGKSILNSALSSTFTNNGKTESDFEFIKFLLEKGAVLFQADLLYLSLPRYRACLQEITLKSAQIASLSITEEMLQCWEEDFLLYLLDQGVALKESSTALFHSLQRNKFKIAEKLIEKKLVDVNGIYQGKAIIEHFIFAKTVDVARFLLDNNAKVSQGLYDRLCTREDGLGQELRGIIEKKNLGLRRKYIQDAQRQREESLLRATFCEDQVSEGFPFVAPLVPERNSEAVVLTNVSNSGSGATKSTCAKEPGISISAPSSLLELSSRQVSKPSMSKEEKSIPVVSGPSWAPLILCTAVLYAGIGFSLYKLYKKFWQKKESNIKENQEKSEISIQDRSTVVSV